MKFVKMHANGDDFVVVDARGRQNPLNSNVAKSLGHRYRGIGFNQLAVMLDCHDAAAQIVFFNADGSTLGACGSATRGVADILMRETGKENVILRTDRGLLACQRQNPDAITVDMGMPLLEWADIPLAVPCDTLHLPLPGDPAACNMGNPHCTFFVEDLNTIDLAKHGPSIEHHPLFPERTNVHFVQILDHDTLRLRIWERGGGVPAGSGSCSCGAAVAAIRRRLTNQIVTVVCDGGNVKVAWDLEGGVKLSGPVTTTFSGEVVETCQAGGAED